MLILNSRKKKRRFNKKLLLQVQSEEEIILKLSKNWQTRRGKNFESGFHLNMQLLSIKELNELKRKSKEINLFKRELARNIRNYKNKLTNQLLKIN
jgi:hypothetical protein